MSKMHLDDSGRIVIENYTARRPFSSFLPGIAGPTGIPLWVFYVNRGQAIASFGVDSKDHPILEFQPANKAYRDTPITGFRTFLKIIHPGHTEIYEPFSAWQKSAETSQRMIIGMNELELEEEDPVRGLQTRVSTFSLPGENYAGLVRKLVVKNLSSRALNLELLDGLPAVIPFGVNNAALKEIGRTIEAWMGVYNLKQGVPFYRLGASTEDSAEVERIEAGHFALSFSVLGKTPSPLPPLVDPNLVFGYNTALTYPDRFSDTPLSDLLNEGQITRGRTPCGFFGLAADLAPDESLTVYTVFGHTGNQAFLTRLAERLSNPVFLEEKRQGARALAVDLTAPIATKTGSPLFDGYCRQTFLDNVLRGGWPIQLKNHDRPLMYHIYSRKHGDLERDYNEFHLAPEPYSQGALNYRDVNQNRRCDVLFNPRVQGFNLRAFISLIQADGYNPLVVQGIKFTLQQGKWAEILALVDQPDLLSPIFTRPFSPGQLLRHTTDHGITLRVSPADFLAAVLQQADHDFEAAHGEGYWVDHWTYNLDQIESFTAVFPERINELLFGEADIPFYDSRYRVRPRAEKYVLAQGTPHQYDAVIEDSEKGALIAARVVRPNWTRLDHGRGEIYRTTLFAKLLILALIKFTTLDPYGMGIEMEAGKPGWYDAVNGLPGLFGSSMPEAYELLRLIHFLISVIEGQEPFTIEVPAEVRRLMEQALSALQAYRQTRDPARDHRLWDEMASAREAYRAAIRLGFAGTSREITSEELVEMLRSFEEKLNLGIERALALNNGFPPTYFTYEAEAYAPLQDAQGTPLQDPLGRPFIQISRFKASVLPAFLEGAVKALGQQPDPAAARALYQQVKASPLYDRPLKMYKVNAPLKAQPHAIGRARAFTPGWLENESIWLHMEYKYILEVLKAGLYTEFFEELKNTLIPFQDPDRYGRSPLENSSFLVSSAHPDPTYHGGGFVARLSGSTAEFLSIWQHMMAGGAPFSLQEDKLCLGFRPVLPGWLFDENDTVTFMFLGQCKVIYHNPQRLDTTELVLKNAILRGQDGETLTVDGGIIGSPYAEMVRAGQISEIHVFFEKG